MLCRHRHLRKERNKNTSLSDLMEVNTLINGDFRNVMKTLPDECMGLILTDPPYGKSYKSNHRKKTKSLARYIHNDDSLTWAKEFLREVYRVLKDNRDIYIFCSWDTYPRWYFLVSKYFKVKSLIVGKKANKGMGDLFASYQANYELVIHAQKGRRLLNKVGTLQRHPGLITNISLAHPDNNAYVHPTQKNVEFCRFLIEKSSSVRDVVFDPFVGSGTTLIAAKQIGRPYFGCEIDTEYYLSALKRLKSVSTRLDMFCVNKKEQDVITSVFG